MFVVIMGCGRVGRSLAARMEALGHNVSVIDVKSEALAKLGNDFHGKRVLGQGFDRNVLTEAGITEADAFAAVSSSDNTNIIAARVAREEFNVDRVIARIYDGRRAEIYERLGIPTIATVPWAADRLLHMITGEGVGSTLSDPSGQISVVELVLHVDWVGKPLSELEKATGGRCAFIVRAGRAAIPTSRTRIQAEDHVWLSVLSEKEQRAVAIGRIAPQEVEV